MELSAHVDEISAWREIRAALRKSLGESMYLVWIDPIRLHALIGRELVLEAPAEALPWLRKRYIRVLERCARSVVGEDVNVAFLGEDATPGAGRQGERERERPGRGGTGDRDPDGKAGMESQLESLNPRHRFDEFIIGDGNRLAHAAALAVAELPGQAYNPLFLYAPPGLGKTHLLHAIGNYVLAFGGGAKVRYATVEAFTNHFISALHAKTLERFKSAYRDADVLLIDDVQFLASKAKTEEEFFHTFNALHARGRQLVLTCDRLPSQLDGIAERLRERFAAGLVADIQPPDHSTRVAILRKRAVLDGVSVADEDVLDLIAERVPDNIRALEGALIRVVAYHSLTGKPLDADLTRKVLDGMHYPVPAARRPGRDRRRPPSGSGSPSIGEVQLSVATHFGLSVEELVSASRAARVAWPRQLAIHLARELTGAPTTTIGSAFGGRNHATVLHACKRVAERAANDQQAAVDIDELSRELRTRLADRPC